MPRKKKSKRLPEIGMVLENRRGERIKVVEIDWGSTRELRTSMIDLRLGGGEDA